MSKRESIKKVLVIGSGPIIIGQAAEFDYAGTQACKTLKEEGINVVLVNSNPATIMTDKNIADNVYIEPLNVQTVQKIIEKEKPDSILPTLGGQNGLNLAMELYESGYLQQQNVSLIGTNTVAIKKAEDRLSFKETMESIGEPCAASKVVECVEDAVSFVRSIGYPVVLRPAYTLGGSGGGIAADEGQLKSIVSNGLRLSRVGQVLVEQCISGWKEIEYESIRDSKGNCIIVCSMENVDPVGVHTGDSIVVAPSQTLSHKDNQMLRNACINIVSALEIEGGCNIQLALHPDSSEYAVIEVNPRLSRSSALASKATGYPIARVTTKIALGYSLDEIENAVTGKTYACFEPTLDYVVVKIPRWPFDKFVTADRTLGTQMKATGEVMGISNSFEGAFMKALRSLEQNVTSLLPIQDTGSVDTSQLLERLSVTDDQRIFVVAEAIDSGMELQKINEITKIDMWFLNKIKSLVNIHQRLAEQPLDYQLLLEAKIKGFTDKLIEDIAGLTAGTVKELRNEWDIQPAFNMVDTCAAEFEAQTPYYYSSYGSKTESVCDKKKKILVIGSGPIRIGQGIEFDYCCVHAVWAFKKCGYQAIIVNNNPETVSTDFDISDKLYFEPLSEEDVQNIVELEQPDGAVVQFGGQTAIKLTKALVRMNVPILGTQAVDIDRAEDRKLFDEIVESQGIPRPNGKTVFTVDEALAAANQLTYPVLVRPSYVLGGQGMQIAFCNQDIKEFMAIINRTVQENPILVDKYIMGREIEVDAICDGKQVLIPGIMEHLERAGVHSGDSISVYPALNLSDKHKQTIVDYTGRLAGALNVVGLINIQFIISSSPDGDDIVYVIEVNPRSSRTIPYISKVTGLPVVEIASKVIDGADLESLGYTGLYPEGDYISVKVPVFSFEKLMGAEITLGPEMKSTGEVLGVSKNFLEALYKGFVGSGAKLPRTKKIIMTVKESDKDELCEIAGLFTQLGYTLYATRGTCNALKGKGIDAQNINRIDQSSPNIIDMIEEGVDLVINTPTQGRQQHRDGFCIRRKAVETGVTCLTSLDTARALAQSLKYAQHGDIDVVDITSIV